MILLDTDIIIDMIKKREYEWGAISTITLIEILRGLEENKRIKIKHLLEESFALLELNNKVVEAYCQLYHKLKKEGTLIPDTDLLIAATAIANNIPLKTRDEHFQRLKDKGLKLA
ncbi:MAG: type II toxin-antitoxin system VapC family toxin [Nitrososphaerota archaeon]